MAATTMPFIAIVLIFCLIAQGKGEEPVKTCYKDYLIVKTTAVGRVVQGKPEYQVVIINGCPCKNSNIRLDCKGFQTVEPVDPAKMVVKGDECVINGNGSFIPPYSSTDFHYAWDVDFPFTPLSCQPDCS